MDSHDHKFLFRRGEDSERAMRLDKHIKRIEIVEVPERFYFKISAAADYTGLSKNTLRKYTSLGHIRAKILPGGDRIYCKEWLDDFIGDLPDAVVNFTDTFRPSAYNPSKSDLSSNPRK